MPGTTTLGFPYPSGTDSMSDEAAKVQELAQFVDDQVGLLKCGTQASGVLVAATPKTVSVVFATAFPAAGPVPKVVATLSGVALTIAQFVVVANVTRSGFDLIYRRDTGTASMDANWIAMAQ